MFDKTDKKLTLDEETKKHEESRLTASPKWLHSKNGFKKAIELMEDIRVDTNNFKSSSGDKFFFNNLDELINEIKNKKTAKENTIEKIKNVVSDLEKKSQKKKQLFFKIKWLMLSTVYLSNSFWISSKPGRLMLPKWANINEERFHEILSTETKAKNKGLEISVDEREAMLDNTKRLLKDLGNGILDGHDFKKKCNNIVNGVEAKL